MSNQFCSSPSRSATSGLIQLAWSPSLPTTLVPASGSRPRTPPPSRSSGMGSSMPFRSSIRLVLSDCSTLITRFDFSFLIYLVFVFCSFPLCLLFFCLFILLFSFSRLRTALPLTSFRENCQSCSSSCRTLALLFRYWHV